MLDGVRANARLVKVLPERHDRRGQGATDVVGEVRVDVVDHERQVDRATVPQVVAEALGDRDARDEGAGLDLRLSLPRAHRLEAERAMGVREVRDERTRFGRAVVIEDRGRRFAPGQPEQAHQHEERDRLEQHKREEDLRPAQMLELHPRAAQHHLPCSAHEATAATARKTSIMSGARWRKPAIGTLPIAAVTTSSARPPSFR